MQSTCITHFPVGCFLRRKVFTSPPELTNVIVLILVHTYGLTFSV